MAEAFIPGEFDYVLREDRGKKDDDLTKTVFHLATLDEHEYAQIEDAMEFTAADIAKIDALFKAEKEKNPRAGAIKVNTKVGSRTLSILRIGLKGWDKFVSKGKPVKFADPENGMCAWANIRALQPKHRSELAAAIESGNTLTEEEEKN